MIIYPASQLRIRDQFYLLDQVPDGDASKPRGPINEVRATGPNGQFTYAPVGSPPGTIFVIDSNQTDGVYLVSLGIIPAEQLRERERFIPAGQPAHVGEPYIYLGANADGLMLGRRPSHAEPIFLNRGDFVQPVL